MRELMVRDAIREALDEEMARDNTVFQACARWWS